MTREIRNKTIERNEKTEKRKSKLTSNAQGLQFPLDRKRVSETPQRQG
jgi:hypothetical protein